jgi:hypothetical protein
VTDDDHTDPPKKSDHRVLAIALAFLAAAAFGFSAFSSKWLYASAAQLQLREGENIVIRVGPVHEVGFGLRAMFRCVKGTCEDMTNGELVKDWRREVLSARFVLGEPVEDELKELAGADHLEKLIRERTALSNPEDPLQQAMQQELTVQKRLYATSSTFVTFGWIALAAAVIAALSLAVAAALVAARKRVVLPIMPTTTALLGIGVALICGCIFVATKPGPPGYVGVGIGFFAFGVGVILGLWSSLYLNKLLRPQDPDLLEDSMNPDQF